MELKNYNYHLLSLLSAAIIPLLVLGPFFPDLIVSLLSLWFIYFSFKNKLYYKFQNIFFYFFLAFCLVCIISSLISENILLSFESSLFYFRIGIFALLISYLIEQDKKILDYFYYSFLITYTALIIDGFVQYFTGFNIVGYELTIDRVSSFFNDELILGSYLVRLFPLFFALFIIKPNKKLLENYFAYSVFACSYVLIFLSGERTSFFFLNLFIIFIVVFLKWSKLIRLIILFTSIILLFFLILVDNKYYERYISTTLKQFSFNTKNYQPKYIFSAQHDSIYRTAWNMFLDKPLIGHGPKMYRIKCKEKKYAVGLSACHTHPHNFYIQLLAETGLIGFIFLLSIFVYLIYLILKHIYRKIFYNQVNFSNYQICLLGGLLITLWPLSPNGSIFNNYLMILYSLQIGFFSIDKKNI
jgi:O-antigen ligase